MTGIAQTQRTASDDGMDFIQSWLRLELSMGAECCSADVHLKINGCCGFNPRASVDLLRDSPETVVRCGIANSYDSRYNYLFRSGYREQGIFVNMDFGVSA